MVYWCGIFGELTWLILSLVAPLRSRMEMGCSSGWNWAQARSTARASISLWIWTFLSRPLAGIAFPMN